jgi:hypothetical protein
MSRLAAEDDFTLEPRIATEAEQCAICLRLGITELTIMPGDLAFYGWSRQSEGWNCADCVARFYDEIIAGKEAQS